MDDVAVNYFRNIFSSLNMLNFDLETSLGNVDSRVTEAMNATL